MIMSVEYVLESDSPSPVLHMGRLASGFGQDVFQVSAVSDCLQQSVFLLSGSELLRRFHVYAFVVCFNSYRIPNFQRNLLASIEKAYIGITQVVKNPTWR